MSKLLTAALLCFAATAAYAGPPDDAAYPTPQIGDGVIRDGALVYERGAYFYGSDCGGSSVLKAAKRRSATGPRGVILGGAEGDYIVSALNCDDRRQALSIYRDAFEGPLGKTFSWHNPNGGGKGTVTLVRRYSVNGAKCSEVRATAISMDTLEGATGTACLQQDGNWHTE